MCLHTGKRGGERIKKLYIKRMAAIGEAMQEGPLFKVSQSSRDKSCHLLWILRGRTAVAFCPIDVEISIVSYAVLQPGKALLTPHSAQSLGSFPTVYYSLRGGSLGLQKTCWVFSIVSKPLFREESHGIVVTSETLDCEGFVGMRLSEKNFLGRQ